MNREYVKLTKKQAVELFEYMLAVENKLSEYAENSFFNDATVPATSAAKRAISKLCAVKNQ